MEFIATTLSHSVRGLVKISLSLEDRYATASTKVKCHRLKFIRDRHFLRSPRRRCGFAHALFFFSRTRRRYAWTCASAAWPEVTHSCGAAATAMTRGRPRSSASRCRARFWKWADWHTSGQAIRWARKSSCTIIPSAAAWPKAAWLITR